jgi:hypothetical protein
MNPEVTITITISVNEEGQIDTAVQAGGAEETILENAGLDGGRESDVIDLPPPPSADALESLAAADLPPVPEIEEALEQATFAGLAIPELPPVPEIPPD